MKRKMSNEPTSKTARSSMAKHKDEPFKASGDMARIIPLAGGTWAYIHDPRDGRLHHLEVGADRWNLLINDLRTTEHAQRINAELGTLGWAGR